MTDFLFSTRRREPGTLAAILDTCLAPAGARSVERHGTWGSVAVATAPHEDPPILGGEALDQSDGDAADEGSVTVLVDRPRVARDPLDALAGDGPVDWSRVFDGAFALLSLDDRGGRIVTDLMGWIPVFAASPGDALSRVSVLGTHPDAVARALNARPTVDPVSVAEFLDAQRVTWPYTLYRDVRQLSPALDRSFDRGGVWRGAGRIYWAPREERLFDGPEEAATELRRALVADVEAACADHEAVGLLLSGGEDARVVLGAVPDDVHVIGCTIAPWENREVRAARRVARAYGASRRLVLTPDDTALDHMPALATLAGSQNEAIDVHTYPHHEPLGLPGLPVVLGGLSSDLLIKGDKVSREAHRHGPGYAPPMPPPRLAGLRDDIAEEARLRRDAHLRHVLDLRPESGHEWYHVWPFTMRRFCANLHGNRRLFRSHEPFHANGVLRVAAAAPQDWKLDRRLFTRAFRPLLAPSWWIPHSRNRMPYFGPLTNRVVRGPLGLARRTRDLVTGRFGSNQESWPLWGDVARSDALERALDRHPPLASALTEAFESAAADVEAARAWPDLSRIALLQLSILLPGAR